MAKNLAQALPKGFRYIPEFVTKQQKSELLQIIMSHPWCKHLYREQQYYGIKYFQTKYQDLTLQNKQSIGHFDLQKFSAIRDKIKNTLDIKSFKQNISSPNQVLVNKYLHKDKLGYHVEDINAFGECILGLSLGDYDYLKLAPKDQCGQNKKGEIKIKLQDREARYNWKHGIGKLQQGKIFKTQSFMRISLTFRDVIQTRRKL